MKLYSNPITPFGRKVTVAIGVLGLTDKITEMTANTNDPDDVLRQLNPLGKIPTLDTGDDAIFDSRVILEYLDELDGRHILLPAEPELKLHTKIRAAQMDGILDAAILVVYEARFRPDAATHSVSWLDYQRAKIIRSLDAIETAGMPPSMTGAYANGDRPDMAEIGLACALDYLDFRSVVTWRDHAPSLVGWLDEFAAAVPSFASSRPA